MRDDRQNEVGSQKSEVRSTSDFRLQTSDFDREIERALAVDPSPEFTARVRTRIASEPAASSWRLSWMFAAAGVAVAAIVFAIVVSRPAHNTAPAPTVARVAPPPVVSGFSRTSPNAPTVSSAPMRNHQVARGSTGSPRARFARPEPEILIDPREAMALQRLIAGVSDGRVDLSPVLRASTPTAMELPPVADLVIAPLTIEPLAPIEGAEGVRQ